ncbi:Glycosyltransferase involved in cell wall bisynthesis [Salegentibacter echinorum]|uniref:Glycosyltransferase involved in cell wall bisynthesis n=1 Tax=Salegentibacter echinorum TaxID=1073325 RepID=A0A1M5LM41_SALEC|nr:glycosyltransferase [Salegentibacter echinorum]SHG65970.1 Glycosyltransferase involved in cell wall bisynthesis [Salegentibacter echinorum]
MKIAVITHTLHSRQQHKLYAYAPYVREMNYWFSGFEEVRVVAPVIPKAKNNLPLEYKKSGIQLEEVPAFSLLSFSNILRTFFLLPFIFYKVFRAMQWGDHVHLRCPGNMGLIGCLVQVFFPKKPKTVKYAGNWDPEAQQPFTYKLQKKILSNTFLSRNIRVLVYGEWPGQSKNILPFFTASFSEAEKPVVEKEFNKPFKFLFVGSLVAGKRPKLAIQLIEKLITKKVLVKLEIYGDGVLRKELEEYVVSKNLEPFVIFFGNKKLETVKEAYKKAHFLILASKSEGWPKAVAEAMFFGCIPIVTSVSCVPWMLGAPSVSKEETNIVTLAERGIIIGSKFKVQGSRFKVQSSGFEGAKLLDQLVQDVEALTIDAERKKEMSKAAQQWSQQYTLERFEKGIREILGKQPQNPNQTANTKRPTENQQPLTGKRLPRSFVARNDTTHNPQPTSENRHPITRNPKQLRVLQLIDSLRPGGAERLTVDLANGLAGKVGFSAVCASRIEGGFKKDLKKEVGYIFLNKKSSVDMGAIFRLKKYIKTNKIELLHAHGTSVFMGCIQKILNPKLKLIWHDHYGNRIDNENFTAFLLKICSLFFDGIICVNKELLSWSKEQLFSKKLRYIPNFVSAKYHCKRSNLNVNQKITIVQLANLKTPKNHLVSLKAFKIIVGRTPDCQLVLVGKGYNDVYSEEIKRYIQRENLQDKVFLKGQQTELKSYLKDAHIGILSSDSEGLPISLLEYGLAGLPVVCTNVGDCEKVVGEFGKLVPKNDPKALAAAILSYLDNPEMMKTDAEKFQQQVIDNYSEEVVLSKFLDFYNEISLNA